MRYLCYTLGDPATSFPEPTPEAMNEMGAFIEEAVKAGVLVATGAVTGIDQAIKVVRKDGKTTVLDGPFTEAKELIGGWALMECRDNDEIIEWTRRFLEVAGEGETTIRPVYGDQ